MRADKQHAGFISARDFADIMKTTKQHLLTPFVRDNLVPVCYLGPSPSVEAGGVGAELGSLNFECFSDFGRGWGRVEIFEF